MSRRLIACLVSAAVLLSAAPAVSAAPVPVEPEPAPVEPEPAPDSSAPPSDPSAPVPDAADGVSEAEARASWPEPAGPLPVGDAPTPLPPSESMGSDTEAAAGVAEMIARDGLAQELPVVKAGTFALDVPEVANVRARVDEKVPFTMARVVEGDDKQPMRSPDQVAVTFVDSVTARQMGVFGFGFEVASTGRDQSLKVEVDYSKFRDLYGANFAERLQLVRFPSCAPTERLRGDCLKSEVVSGFVNDVEAGVISAIVPVDFDLSAFADAVAAPGVVIDQGDVAGRRVAGFGRSYRASGSGGSTYGVSAGVATEYGSYLATPLAASSSWSVGMSMGSFQWSYPVPAPPTGWGEAPSVSMSYNSVAVDGVVSDQNNQNGLLGAGWSLNAGGFIERNYKTCNTDGGGIGDFCWVTDNATIVLNGQSSDLVFKSGDPATWSEWRLKNDPGWKVVRQRGSSWSSSSDQLGEIWWVYSPDGTEYQFGARRVAGGGEFTESVWHMPVYGNHVGEPCYNSWCQQAWRWNLDRVKDRFGNVTYYMYTAERNNYSRGGAPSAVTPYVRGGWLREIRYGTRVGSETSYRNIIRFNTKERCFSTDTSQCLWYGSNTIPWFPDAPIDKRCADGAGQCPLYAPAFWTERALDTIDTFVFDADQMGSGNYVPSPSFEGGSAGWAAYNPSVGITNWTVYGSQPNNAKDGSSYLAANVASPGGSVYTDMAVTPQPGFPYTMTAWVRSPSGTPIAGQMVLWGLWGTVQNAAVNFVADGSWKPVTLQFVPTAANNTSMRAQFYINTTGADLNIDFVSVMPPWQLVDRIKPTFDWPDPNGQLGGEPAQLWLRTISRTGKPSGPAPITVPDIRFESAQLLDNRADALTHRMWRITQVNDELGGQTEVGYGQPKGAGCTMPTPGWMYNEQDCYPRYSVVSGYSGFVAYARYYVGTVTRRDLVAGGPAVTTGYVYAGNPAYRYDNEPFITNRTWSDSRGYGQVFTFTGPDGNGRYDRSWHWFFRGMHADSLGQYGTRTVNLPYAEGSWQLDYDWLNGREYQTEVHNATIMVTRDETFFNGVETALASGVQAVRVDAIRTKHTSLETGGALHITQARTAYDPVYGTPIEVVDDGSLAGPGDETCTSIQYARNTAVTDAWVVNLVGRTYRAKGTNAFPGGWGNCDELASAELGLLEQSYDGQPHLQSTAVGFMTLSRTRASATSTWLETTYVGDGAGHVTQLDGPLTGTQDLSTFFYTFGVRWAQRDGTGHTTSQDIDPARGTVRYSVDWNDTLNMPGAPDGPDKVTVIDSDALGRTTAVQLPGDPNPTLRFSYGITKVAPSWVRSSAQITDGVWRDSVEFFDGLGRPKETQVPSPNGGRLLSAVEYDGRSHAVKSFDAKHYTGAPGVNVITTGPFGSAALESETRTTYDDLGRVINTALFSNANPVVREGANVQTTTEYDGHWTKVYPAVGSPTFTHANALGQVDSTTEFNTTWSGGRVTNYAYDLNDNLISTTDPKGNVTTTAYDNLGRSTVRTDRDRGTVSMTYNADGTVATMSDANSSLTYESDRLGRVTAIRSNGTLLEQYVYDATGEAGLMNYVSSFYNGAELRIDVNGYDTRNRPTGYTYTIPSITGFTDTTGLAGSYNFNAFTYRRDDQVNTMAYPAFGALAAETVTVGYNTIGNPTTLAGAVGALVGDTTYTPEGRLGTRTYGATTDTTYKVTRSYGWNLATGQLTSLTATQNGVTLQGDSYGYDANGNLTWNTHDPTGTADDHTECYQYDGRNRLRRAFTTGAVAPAGTCTAPSAGGPAVYDNTYAIDEIGNFTTGPAGAYTYPASGTNSDKPHAPTTAGANTFTWNPDGTMLTKTTGGVTSTYAWDQFDRLRSVTKGPDVTTMIYYPGGQRALMKDTAGVHLYFDGYGERHANTGGGSSPTTVTSKTWDSTAEGMVSWYNSTLTNDTTTKRTGAASLKVTSSSPWFGIVDFGTPQTITPGNNYTFSVYARANTTAANVNLVVRWLNSSWDQLGYVYAVPSGNDTATGWTQFATAMVAPPDAAMVRFGVQINGSSSGEVHWFDDYTLTSSTVTTATVAAKGFETTTDNMTSATAATVAATTAQAKTGTRSLAVTPTGAWTVTDASAGIAVTPLNTYRVTGWAKIATGSGTMGVKVDWYNTSNGWLRSDDIVQHENLAVWASFTTHNMTPPAGAAYAKIRLTGDNGAVWYIDDLSLGTVSNPPAATLTERRYYQLGGVSIGSRTRDTVTNIDRYHYFLGDTRGSTSLAVQRGTATVDKQWYDPYGKPRGTATITATDRGYIGQYEDATTGLGYLNNRYHDPTTGVFLSVDPLVSKTGESYLYASGNPTTLSDPDGLESLPGGEWMYEDIGAVSKTWDSRHGHYKAMVNTWTDLNHMTGRGPMRNVGPGYGSSMLYDGISAVGDKLATIAVYERDALNRRLRNPFQSFWDDVTLTTAIEQAAALEAILVDDAEIYRDGPYCGPEVECLTGADTLGGRDATTFGHTQRYQETRPPTEKLIAHETQHSYDIENIGGVGFYGLYGFEWYMRSGICDCNAYEQLSWEKRANIVQSGWDTGTRPRGILSGGPR